MVLFIAIAFLIWAASSENVSMFICEQRGPRSDCASAQFDQGIRCSLKETMNTA